MGKTIKTYINGTITEIKEGSNKSLFVSSSTAEERRVVPVSWMDRAPLLTHIICSVTTGGRQWLTPYLGALDVWHAVAPEMYPHTAGELEDWALTAHVGDTAAMDAGGRSVTLSIYSR